MHSEGKKKKGNGQSLKQRKVYCRAMKGEWVDLASQNPDPLEGFQQSIFKDQVREGGHEVCDELIHNSLIG